MYAQGMSSLLQESATVAWDTTKKAYVNPTTGASYGADPPPGFWRIGPTNIAEGYDPAYCLSGPMYGCPNVQAGGQAATTGVTTTSPPASTTLPQSTTNQQNVSTGTATGGGTSTNATQATGTDVMSSISSLLSGNMGLVLGVGAVLLLMMMGGGEEHHGRHN